MRVLVQRVQLAKVAVGGETVGRISKGLLLFLGIGHDDEEEDLNWLVNKVLNLRVFEDDAGKMNLSVKDIQGEVLLVSQFTLHASTKKGNRPSFIAAAAPEKAKKMYDKFGKSMALVGVKVEYGVFGANMQVSLLNDGPVTIWMDTKNKE
ncbi:MAG: D-tyrosyl-tRNA(Tyr) deacylase [Crocinitomicaceae bacterium]|nr:D-tyrosyl-tRNA(Tyr) deacylase [Crocinitomicaceae bacterium]